MNDNISTGAAVAMIIVLLALVAFIAMMIYASVEDRRVRLECALSGYERYESRLFGADYCIEVVVEEQTNTVRLSDVTEGER